MFRMNTAMRVGVVVLKAGNMELRFQESLDLVKEVLGVLGYDRINEIDKLVLKADDAVNPEDDEEAEQANLLVNANGPLGEMDDEGEDC
jgi:hypothetical protein